MTAPAPIGGTTGVCHESSAAVDDAARWLAAEPDTRGRAVIPELKQRFGLTSLEACQAIRQANELRRVAG